LGDIGTVLDFEFNNVDFVDFEPLEGNDCRVYHYKTV
jgi:hypothetical protein